MIVLAMAVFGALSGVMVARRRGGQRLDLVHHAAVGAIGCAVLGMIVTIIVSRMAQG
ncbi:MAG: hypothetical protein ACT4OK_21355 [Gemmobacter sp.]